MLLIVRRAVPARASLPQLLLHASLAAALNTVLLVSLAAAFRPLVASALYTFLAPGVAGLVAWGYFRRSDAAEPLVAAIAFTAIGAIADLAAIGMAGAGVQLLDPAFGIGFPLLLTFGATGLVGEIVPTLRRARHH